MPMVEIPIDPIGVVLERPKAIRVRVTNTLHIWGWSMTVTDSLGRVTTIVSGNTGAGSSWATGFAGVVTVSADLHTCDFTVTSWPAWVEGREILTFAASAYEAPV